MAKEHPRYANTEFPDYEFREYPMMVYPGSKDGGKTPDRDPTKPGKLLTPGVVVNNEEEHRQALGGDGVETVQAGGVTRIKTEEDERQALIQEAETLGVTIDKRWSIARIQDAIDTAKNEAAVV